MSVLKKKIKYIIALCVLIITMLSSLTMATSSDTTVQDVIAPRGRITLLNSEEKNNTNYVSGTEVEVEIYAKDDKCADSEIKYYLSTSPISNLGEIADESWKNYSANVIEKITLSGDASNNIYVAFKDATGNTSTIHNTSDSKYTIQYEADAEIPTGINATGYYGMPFVVTSQIPKKEGYTFKGWSTNPDATDASYEAGSIIPANVFKGAGKTIALNAIWKSDNIVNIDNLGEIELSNPNADLTYNPNTGDLGGAVPPPVNEPETPVEIPEENLPEIIEFGCGTFESKTSYTPGTYETVEYETTYTRTKYPVSYQNVVWSEWEIIKDSEGKIYRAGAGNITLAEIGEHYSTYIVYDFETEKALETNGVKGDSVELWTIYSSSEDSLENAVYLAAYLNRADGKTTRHIAKWNGSQYVEYDADAEINAVDTFIETYTITETKQVQITAPSSSTEYVYIPVGNLKAEKGMTWAEWLESDYNTIGVASPKIKTADYDNVSYDDAIVAGQEYGFIVAVQTVNAPILGKDSDGNLLMEAVYWSDENASDELTADEFTSEMYSYVKGDGVTDAKQAKWANAKTKDDGSYWVWIPRYAYKITYYTDEAKTTVSTDKTQYGSIDVLFLKGTSNSEYYDGKGGTVTTGLPAGYKVHPAFQKMETTEDLATNPLGKWDSELEGIWVAKYEASQGSSGKVESKPSVTSWRSITQSDIYSNCLNINTTLNSHQMKNSEWGAVSYLAYSAYGRNGNELAVNQCEGYYTGAGPGIGSSTIYNSIYGYDSSSFAGTYAWNTEQGKLTSTTGNIYGVYDMSGGACEYAASYVDNGNDNDSLIDYGASMVNSTVMRNKQVYEAGSSDDRESNYNANSSIYGDAIYETSTSYSGVMNWCGDYSYFPDSNFPFFEHGRYCGAGSSAGAFAFISDDGGDYNSCGFRPILCVTSGS